MFSNRLAIVGTMTVITAAVPFTAAADPISISLTVTSGTIRVGNEVEGGALDIAGPEFSLRAGDGASLEAHSCFFPARLGRPPRSRE
jgi:hypothetical protein